MRALTGPSLEPSDLAFVLDRFREGFLVIDEIHGLKRLAQELFYPVMSNGTFHWRGSQIKVNLAVIGTTTRRGELDTALRNRFGLEVWIAPYAPEDIKQIVLQAAGWLDSDLSPEAAGELAAWGRGIPRTALQILKRARDLAFLHSGGKISKVHVLWALSDLGFDVDGLLPEERQYLKVLIYLGGQTGLANLAAAMQQDKESIRLLEAWLLRSGLVALEARGRKLTESGLELASRRGWVEVSS